MTECEGRPTLGDNVFTQVGTFHTLVDGTIVVDGPKTSKEDEG